ncbi:MAG: hypothetical protein H7Y36_02915 [Armatimonadetes bacterium]|nr:hypothetical protein [Akkermansiaceae bacterium]
MDIKLKWFLLPESMRSLLIVRKLGITIKTLVFFWVCTCALAGQANPGNERVKRLTRAESFFGLHFDFHAGPDCTEIGKNTTPGMIEKIIASAHPDYIQIDCKGHPGLSSYPTKVGNQAPGFVGDPLRVWRDVTAKNGVALYMHYSGVWDSEAIRQHPDWGVISADGKTDANAISFFGPYDEKLLIPQLRELADDYGVDGAWVDGECWASKPDFSEAALRAFRKQTGINKMPRQPGEPHWFEFLQFNREAFRNHIRHYIAEVKKTNPRMQLCSNWAFSDHMPEEVSAPVDWISGDLNPEDSVNAARFSARYLANQGKPWDLMGWSFVQKGDLRNGSKQKSAIQLQREAALVMAQGGGFQPYYNQTRDGSVPEIHLPVIGELAAFCRARQAFCQGAKPLPQIALLYSTESNYREIKGLFTRDLSRISGTLQALLESQHTVDVVSEHNLAKRMAQYPLIVIGECDYLEPGFKQLLIAYAEKGGKLLIIGPSAASLFAAELDVSLDGIQEEPRVLANGNIVTQTKGPTSIATLGKRAKPFGQLLLSKDSKSGSQPAASIATLGKGNIAATYFSFSHGYLAERSPGLRGFLTELTQQLFQNPILKVTGSNDVEVTVNRLKGKLAINLINTSGAHWDMRKTLIDSITPIGPLEVTLRTVNKPAKITLQPEGQSLPFEFNNGDTHLTVPSLKIHSVLVVEK